MSQPSPVHQPHPDDDTIDFVELFARLRRGFPVTLGLACIGLAVAAVAVAIGGPFQFATTSTRVVFAFPGFERGEYPDKSKFSPFDIRSPEIVNEALRRKGIIATDDLQAKVRAALSIDGIIPDSVVREREKLRAAGQTPRLYVPDEYELTLMLPRMFPLPLSQREAFLIEVVSLFKEKFTRNYVSLPMEAGKAFESLTGADYFDYDIVLNRESENITRFLTDLSGTARSFRSTRTNLTFGDLLKETQLFTQIRLNEVLGLIRRDGISRDRKLALVKMDYYLKTLGDDELRATEEERVIHDLLKQAQEREQRLALGVKSQTTQQRSDGLVVDQGLVDSLLANDAYNFLVRQALDASLKTRRIQSEKTILAERRKTMEAFINSSQSEKMEARTQFDKSLGELKKNYEDLMTKIRLTFEDYQQQQYADAIRISMQPKTGSFYRGLVLAGIVGFGVGGALGVGLSLLGISSIRPKVA